ncbi:MAG: hypothetical protein M1820_007864 [Bogoriella megaspora]|nr:MAG: hypothetical protein M1820_007864 [Bogoriella megaspora]
MERVILSNKYIDELRTLPEIRLSTKEAVCDRHLGWYSTVDVIKQSNLHADVCRVQLTQNMGYIVPGMVSEIEDSLSRLLPFSEEIPNGSHETPSWSMLLIVANKSISRALVGPDLCRDASWLEASLGYATNVFAISQALRDRAHILRPFLWWRLEARSLVRRYRQRAKELLEPLIEERQRSKGQQKDVLQWMVDSAEGQDRTTTRISQKMLMVCLAGISSNTMAVLNALLDLCAMPQYFEPLREEIKQELGTGGEWELSALHRMQKLDSFLKEKMAKDAAYYAEPDKFHPFRFYDLRRDAERTLNATASPSGKDQSQDSKCDTLSTAKNANRYQFSSTSATSLPFGYGKSACPGRFFATVHIKLMFAFLISNYDISFPKGVTERPENVFVDERSWPSRSIALCFKARRNGKN